VTARQWRIQHRHLRVLRDSGKTTFALTSEELEALMTDYADEVTKGLKNKLKTARIRIGICAGRMESCNEQPQKHELVEEVRAWEKEMKEEE